MRITKSRLAIWPGLGTRLLALSAGLALVASLVTATGSTAAAGVTAAQGRAGAGGPAVLTPTVQWGACSHGIPAPFQCATAPVPLDYRHPNGQKIGIALMRLPASDPSERIGSLFIDFGGPGGPDITDLVNRADTVFSPATRARFDLVTWDPRGVEYSDPVNCFATDTADTDYYNSIPVFPYPQSGEPAFFQLNAQLGPDCLQRSAALMRHVSSADTARDLNVLRQDVGDPKLTYLGFSYGTVIGATYANLFPGQVRAMVLDGTLDFVGNATGHFPGEAAAFPVDVRQGVRVLRRREPSGEMGNPAGAGAGRAARLPGPDDLRLLRHGGPDRRLARPRLLPAEPVHLDLRGAAADRWAVGGAGAGGLARAKPEPHGPAARRDRRARAHRHRRGQRRGRHALHRQPGGRLLRHPVRRQPGAHERRRLPQPGDHRGPEGTGLRPADRLRHDAVRDLADDAHRRLRRAVEPVAHPDSGDQRGA